MKKSKRWPWILAAVLVFLILGGAGTVYGLGVYRYSECFLRGTIINGVDCGDKKPAEVSAILDSRLQNYTLEVSGRNPENPAENTVIGVIRPEDVELHRKDTDQLVGKIFAEQNAFRWVEMLWKDGRSYEFDQDVVFDEALLKKVMEGWDACGEERTIAPKDASISEYSPEENAYHLLSEEAGTKMNPEKALPVIGDALCALEAKVDVESTGCYNEPAVTLKDRALNETVETANKWLSAKISYDWYGTEITVGPEELNQWVSIEDEKPCLDEEAVAEFVQEKAKEADPNGHYYTFRTTLGVDVNLKCITGWTTDCEKEAQELSELIRQGADVEEREPVSATHNYVQFRNGVGNSYVEVDITNQHVYLYYKGQLIIDSDCVTGDVASGNATPEGIFALKFKERDRVLVGPDYESFVSYWMPYYRGYGLHDATWRRVFGGQIYLNNGSHGCVNLPTETAQTLYNSIGTGYPVVCYYYPEGQNPAEQPQEEGPVEENEIRGQW